LKKQIRCGEAGASWQGEGVAKGKQIWIRVRGRAGGVPSEQDRRGHEASWSPSLLGAELGRATKPVFDGGDADPGRNDHQSRKKREGEAQGGKGLPVGAGAHRWEQEAAGAYPDTRVREATGGGRAQENGAARFGGFF
jgi:hypothetical protein